MSDNKTIKSEDRLGPKISFRQRFFFWKPQWGYRFPIRFVRGADENQWRTIGIVTWAGSIFFRTNYCICEECVEASNQYWTFVKQEEQENLVDGFQQHD